MAKKKVNIKETKKEEILKIIAKALQEVGIEVLEGTDYGFTATTLVARTTETDIQIKLITPKAGVIRYEEVE